MIIGETMNNNKGFTLVELLVAISILAILTLLAIPTLRAFQSNNSKTQYLNYKKALNTSGKLYNDSYSEDLFGNSLYGCQKVDLTEMIYKKIAKDIELKDVSCNISSKDSYIIVKKYNNEYKYQASLYCENSKHVEQYSDKDNIISDCLNDTGAPWIDIESVKNETKDTKNKSVVIVLLDNYGFIANQEIKYAWSTSESAPAASSTSWKTYKYNNQVKRTSGGTVRLKSNSITIPGASTGKYYLYVKPIKVQNILNNSFTETKKYGPFRFDHTAPQCNQITVTPNVTAGSYSKEVKFNFTYASSLDDLKGYDLSISYDNGVHWTTVKANADKSYNSYTVDKDGDVRYKLVNLVDYAGNKTNECTMSGVFHRDTKPPTCSINVDGTKSKDSNYYYVTTKFNLTSSELNSLSYGMNTKSSTVYNSQKTITVNSDGSNNIYGYVKDRAGNPGSCSNSLTTTKKYTVTFNSSCGTPNPKTKAVYWKDKIGTLATASKTGYIFDAWYTASTGGSKVSTSTVMPRSNVTYYARCNPKTVDVTFDCNGGSGGGSETFTYGKSGQKFSKTCTRAGYNLDGWKLKKDATARNYTKDSGVSNDWINSHSPKVTIYAHWVPKTVVVAFDCNGGSGGGSETFTYGKSGQKFSKTCTKTNSVIDGWKLKKDGTARDYTTNSGVSDSWIDSKAPSVTVYAHWKEAPKYTVKVVAGEGTNSVSLNGSSSALTKTVYSGTKVKIGATAKKYYQFDSWSNGDKKASTEVTVNSDLTLTATSRTNKIRIFYHCNGGELIPGDVQRCPELANCKENECSWPQRKACRDPKTNNGVCWITGPNDYQSKGWADEGLRNHGGKKDATIFMKKGSKKANRCWTVKETGVVLHEQSTFSSGLVLLNHCGGSYSKDLETKDVDMILLAGYGSGQTCTKKDYTK